MTKIAIGTEEEKAKNSPAKKIPALYFEELEYISAGPE